MVVLPLVPHPVPSEAAQRMLEQPGGTLNGALGEVFVLEPAGDRSQRCVVPGLAVREPLVELPDQVRRLVGYPAHLLCGGIIELAAGAQQDGKLDDATAQEMRSEEHTSELQSLTKLVCRLLLEKKNKTQET